MLIESWGHKIICSPNYKAKYLYTAGTVEERISDFIWALKNPAVDIIWFIRGGYGTAELLAVLEKTPISKPVIGFSDATALLSYLWNSKQRQG